MQKNKEYLQKLESDLQVKLIIFPVLQRLENNFKEKIIWKYWFRKIHIFENWIYSLRFLRNLLCHWEKILFKKYEQKIIWRVIAKKLNFSENDNFLSYLVILEIFNILIWWSNSLFLNIKNNLPVWGQISKIKIEAWQVLIQQIYQEFIRNQVFPNYFFLDKQSFPENELEILENIIEKHKNNWKSIIWTNWCFDILHPGHIETFKKAKEIADILIVWVNWKDSPYWKTKPWRPINNEKFRTKMLDSLKFVDYVYIFNDKTPEKPVGILKPDFVLKWWDYIQESAKNYTKEVNWIIDTYDIF